MWWAEEISKLVSSRVLNSVHTLDIKSAASFINSSFRFLVQLAPVQRTREPNTSLASYIVQCAHLGLGQISLCSVEECLV